MKCRVWYHLDGKISVSYPDVRAGKKLEGFTMEQWIDKQLDDVAKKALRFKGLDYEDMDSSQLPVRDENRDRWRGSKTEGIKIASNVVLRQDLMKQVDVELAKPNPDVIILMRLQRKLDKREHD